MRKDEFLQRIHGYRPAATILEVSSTAKTAGKSVMAGKRLKLPFFSFVEILEFFVRSFHDRVVARQKKKTFYENSPHEDKVSIFSVNIM